MSGTQKTVLVVEDEKSLSRVLSDKLQIEGFSVMVASNGQEGLALMEKQVPDLVLLDIVMPLMDGITMLKKIRSVDAWKNIPVIILTNISDPLKMEESIENGGNDYLIKSAWTIENIVKKIRERIEG